MDFFQYLDKLPWPTIFATFICWWFFTRSIKADIKDLKSDLDRRVEDIQKEFKFINTRLSRVEGTVYGKDIYKTPTDTPSAASDTSSS